MLSWADERGLVLMNDGCVTRLGRESRTGSSPDVTFASRSIAGSLRWRVLRKLGSDHFPILLAGEEEVRGEEKERRELSWDWKRDRWAEYRREVRQGLQSIPWKQLKLTEAVKELGRVIMKAGHTWIGKRLRRSEEVLVSGRVREEMGRRDELKEADDVDWEAVEEAEGRIKELVREEKEGRWRCLLEKGASWCEMWSVVRGAKRKVGPSTKKGEVLVDGERAMVTARQKAMGFLREYERVSRVSVPRGRRLKGLLNERLRGDGPEGEDAVELTLEEVREALLEMDGGKAGGPDGIHPKLLKELPEEALVVVRCLFERSFVEGI